MNQTLTGSALTLHNLGLAAGFGGSLFGQMAMRPAVRAMNGGEGGRVLREAWHRFTPTNAFALGSVVATWVVGRTALSGGEVDRQTRALVIAKDLLVGIYAATGVASIVLGKRRAKQALHPEGIQSPQGSLEAGWDASSSSRLVNRMGLANLIAGAGIIALTAALNVKAERSYKWRWLSRLLP